MGSGIIVYCLFYLKDRNILRLTASKARIKALGMLIVVSVFSYELFPKCLFFDTFDTGFQYYAGQCLRPIAIGNIGLPLDTT